jgi:putative FmdB family regulatory protein
MERKGGSGMPTYDFQCQDCGKKFTLSMTVAEHGKSKVACPKCKGRNVKQLISPFLTKTSRKS